MSVEGLVKTETFFGDSVGDVAMLRGTRKVRTRLPENNPVADALADGVNDLMQVLAMILGAPGILSIRVADRVGLALGIPPGVHMSIMTAVGLVSLEVGPAGPGVDELRQALRDALRELHEHACEYNHVTSKAKLEAWRRLCEP